MSEGVQVSLSRDRMEQLVGFLIDMLDALEVGQDGMSAEERMAYHQIRNSVSMVIAQVMDAGTDQDEEELRKKA